MVRGRRPAFEAPTVVAGLDDVAAMGQPVEQRSGHLGIAALATSILASLSPRAAFK